MKMAELDRIILMPRRSSGLARKVKLTWSQQTRAAGHRARRCAAGSVVAREAKAEGDPEATPLT